MYIGILRYFRFCTFKGGVFFYLFVQVLDVCLQITISTVNKDEQQSRTMNERRPSFGIPQYIQFV